MADTQFGDDGDDTGTGETPDIFTRSSQQNDIALDTVFDVLRDPERRLALSYLRGTDQDTVPVERLVAAVTAMLRPARPEVDPPEVSVSLRHSHLPRLAAAGVIEYDRDDDTVRYNSIERVESFLDLATEEDPLL